MTTYDHIQELRAEFVSSIDQAERRRITVEIATAEAKFAEEEAEFALIAGEPPH